MWQLRASEEKSLGNWLKPNKTHHDQNPVTAAQLIYDTCSLTRSNPFYFRERNKTNFSETKQNKFQEKIRRRRPAKSYEKVRAANDDVAWQTFPWQNSGIDVTRNLMLYVIGINTSHLTEKTTRHHEEKNADIRLFDFTEFTVTCATCKRGMPW